MRRVEKSLLKSMESEMNMKTRIEYWQNRIDKNIKRTEELMQIPGGKGDFNDSLEHLWESMVMKSESIKTQRKSKCPTKIASKSLDSTINNAVGPVIDFASEELSSIPILTFDNLSNAIDVKTTITDATCDAFTTSTITTATNNNNNNNNSFTFEDYDFAINLKPTCSDISLSSSSSSSCTTTTTFASFVLPDSSECETLLASTPVLSNLSTCETFYVSALPVPILLLAFPLLAVKYMIDSFLLYKYYTCTTILPTYINNHYIIYIWDPGKLLFI